MKPIAVVLFLIKRKLTFSRLVRVTYFYKAGTLSDFNFKKLKFCNPRFFLAYLISYNLTFKPFSAIIFLVKVKLFFQNQIKNKQDIKEKGERIMVIDKGKIIASIALVILIILMMILMWFGFKTEILRKIGTEKEIFSQDLWDKGVFLEAKNNQAVILNLGPVDEFNFFVNGNKVESSAYFLLSKQKNLIITVKDSEDNLVDITNISRHISPGDIICYCYELIEDGSYKLSVYIYHGDTYILEKIPIFTSV